ncbi:MAG: acetylornithine deacetylase [Acidobacteriaceae bacterium]
MAPASTTTATEILDALVRIPSVSSLSNRPVIEYAGSLLQQAGWQTHALPYHDANGVEKINLLAMPSTQNLDAPAVDLAFVCHTDTVPYNATWSGATQPVVQDGMLHGCGACDVKGFLACVLGACVRVPVQQIDGTVAIVLTAEEEIGCLGAQRLVASGVVRPRRVVIGEPTMLHPARAGKGYCLAEITVHGKEAHSAHPAQGASAIYRAARLIAAIERYATGLQRTTHPLFDPPYTTLNIGRIEGGTAKNIVPGECRFLLEWRPIPGPSAELVPDAIAALARELRCEDPDFDCSVKPLRQQNGFDTAAGSPLVQRLTALTQRPAIAVPFGTEAPYFATLAEEVVVLGPGDMRTAHSDRECVPIAELDACVGCLADLLLRHIL